CAPWWGGGSPGSADRGRPAPSESRGEFLEERDLVGLAAFAEIGQIRLRGILPQAVQAGPQQVTHGHGIVAFALVPPGAKFPQVADQVLERLCLHASPRCCV